jgi:hypothetical protein
MEHNVDQVMAQWIKSPDCKGQGMGQPRQGNPEGFLKGKEPGEQAPVKTPDMRIVRHIERVIPVYKIILQGWKKDENRDKENNKDGYVPLHRKWIRHERQPGPKQKYTPGLMGKLYRKMIGVSWFAAGSRTLVMMHSILPLTMYNKVRYGQAVPPALGKDIFFSSSTHLFMEQPGCSFRSLK